MELAIQWSERIAVVDQLVPYEKNPRRITEAAYSKLKSSIAESGYHMRIIATPDLRVIGGHMRIRALKDLGITEVPVLVPSRELTEQEFRRILITDNISHGSWDIDELANSFDIEELQDWGFPAGLLDEFPDEVETEHLEGSGDEDDAPEPPVQPVTVAGDLWLLGKHRLYCSDSTSTDAVEKLLDGAKPELAYCDPPYGMDEKCDRSERQETFKAKPIAGYKHYQPIIGDKTTDTATGAFSIATMLCDTLIFWGANYYCDKLPASACWIIWDKREDDKHIDQNSDGELAYVKHPHKRSVRIFRHLWKGMIKASEHGQARVHPTQKPIALAEWCFQEYAQDSKTVLDLFGGSGSTLIACEKTGRTALIMEMSEAYCDTIIQRFQKYSNTEATHAESGETFNAIERRVRGKAA